MAVSKEISEIVRKRKEQPSCVDCSFCNTGAFNGGRWYCQNPEVSIFDGATDITKCFKKRGV